MVFDRKKSFWEYLCVPIMSSSYGVQSHSQFFTILLAGFTRLKELQNLEINAFKSFVEPKKELAVYGCGGFEYCLNLGFRIASIVLDFSLFLTYAIIGGYYYRGCRATAS